MNLEKLVKSSSCGVYWRSDIQRNCVSVGTTPPDREAEMKWLETQDSHSYTGHINARMEYNCAQRARVRLYPHVFLLLPPESHEQMLQIFWNWFKKYINYFNNPVHVLYIFKHITARDKCKRLQLI